MLRITKQVMARFAEAAALEFEDDMVRHVAKYFPDYHRLLGESQIRLVVRHAVKRARGHRIDTERGICLYLTVMLMLGGNFDVDLWLPWAGDGLGELESPNILVHQSIRMDKVANEAVTFLDSIYGPNNAYLTRVLSTVRKAIPELFLAGEPRSLLFLRKLFPQKVEALGDELAQRLIDTAVDTAIRRGLTSWRGTTGYMVCSFLLGSGFDTDPLLPWATAALNYPGSADVRADRLYEGGLGWLDGWLAMGMYPGGTTSIDAFPSPSGGIRGL